MAERQAAAPALPSICFVAPTTYPVLAGDGSHGVAGGAEVQQTTIAAELARRGYRVSMISMDYGQREGDIVRGVRVHRMFSPRDGWPVVRFVHPRLTSLWSAMRRADADVYYQRTAAAMTAFVVAFARRHGRRSVFAGAHDADFSVDLPLLRFARDRALYRWGVRRADAIVVQSERQRASCLDAYGRQAVQINSCGVDGGQQADHGGVVLWVANAKSHKRPHLFLELAARLPQYRFRLVGGPTAAEPDYYEQLRVRAMSLRNVEMCGFVPLDEVGCHFDGASVFVNTSVGEGFPNTFLQAWSRGVPTISFFDPATSVDGEAVGAVVRDVDQMAEVLHRLRQDGLRWRRASELAYRAFEQRHSLRHVGDDYERLLAGLAQRPASGTAAVGGGGSASPAQRGAAASLE